MQFFLDNEHCRELRVTIGEFRVEMCLRQHQDVIILHPQALKKLHELKVMLTSRMICVAMGIQVDLHIPLLCSSCLIKGLSSFFPTTHDTLTPWTNAGVR